MPWPKGKSRSALTRERMRKAHKKRLQDPTARAEMEANLAFGRGPWTEEHKEEQAARMRDREVTESTKAKLRTANLGKVQSEETRRRRSETMKRIGHGKANRGRKPTPETRAKMSASHKRRYQDPAVREARIKANREMWKAKGGKHTPETIEKMREARAKQVMPLVDTKPELTVQNILRTLGVKFQTHRSIAGLGRHQFDLVLEKRHLLIEVDGCYWHGCAKCIPEERRDLGRRNQVRDRQLNRHAFRKGWRMVRIWEHEIESGEVEGILRNALGLIEREEVG